MGILRSRNKAVNSGFVFNRLSTHKPPKSAATTMIAVTQPIWDNIPASTRFLAIPTGRFELTTYSRLINGTSKILS
jgi:hypothetical protein